MTDSFWDNLDTDQIDALQEIGNIGSGHSANALADLLNRRIDMSLPRYFLFSPEEFSKVNWTQFRQNTTVAVCVCQTKGDLKSQIIVVLDEIAINFLLKVINSLDSDINFATLGILDKSIILEVGSILSLHYLTAINTFLGTKSFPQTPYLMIDASDKVLSALTKQMASTDRLLLVECDIFTTDIKFKPIVIFSPQPETVEKTLNAMFGA